MATCDEEVAALEHIRSAAAANGVELEWLDVDAVRELEPAVSAVRGLWSPFTGIVDSHAFMSALREDAERAGTMVVLGTQVISGRGSRRRGRALAGRRRAGAGEVPAVVNCAGLWAPEVARRIEGFPPAYHPPAALRQGALLRAHRPVAVPPPGVSGTGAGGLGMHVTLEPRRTRPLRSRRPVGGLGRLGVRRVARPTASTRSVRRYWPGLRDGALQPGLHGHRPKVTGPGEPPSDFLVHGPSVHGVPGLVGSTRSSHPGSPPHWPWRRRSRLWSRPSPPWTCGRARPGGCGVPASPR